MSAYNAYQVAGSVWLRTCPMCSGDGCYRGGSERGKKCERCGGIGVISKDGGDATYPLKLGKSGAA